MGDAFITRRGGAGGGINPYVNFDENECLMIGETKVGVACELKVTEFEDLASLSLASSYPSTMSDYKIPQYDDRFVCWLSDTIIAVISKIAVVEYFTVSFYEYSNGNLIFKSSSNINVSGGTSNYVHIKRISDTQFCIVWYKSYYTYAIAVTVNPSSFVCTSGKQTQIAYNSNSGNPPNYGFQCHTLGRNVIVNACTGFTTYVAARYSFVPFFVNENNGISIGTFIGNDLGNLGNDTLIKLNEKELVALQYFYPSSGNPEKNTISLIHLKNDGTLKVVATEDGNAPLTQVRPQCLAIKLNDSTIVAGFYECNVVRSSDGVPSSISIINKGVLYPSDYGLGSLSEIIPCPSALWAHNNMIYGKWVTYHLTDSSSELRVYQYNSIRKSFELVYKRSESSFYKYGYGKTYDSDKVVAIEPCGYNDERTTIKVQKRGVLGVKNQETEYPYGVTISKDVSSNTAIVAVPKAL